MHGRREGLLVYVEQISFKSDSDLVKLTPLTPETHHGARCAGRMHWAGDEGGVGCRAM